MSEKKGTLTDKEWMMAHHGHECLTESNEEVVIPLERDLTDAKMESPPAQQTTVHQDDSVCDYSRLDNEYLGIRHIIMS